MTLQQAWFLRPPLTSDRHVSIILAQAPGWSLRGPTLTITVAAQFQPVAIQLGFEFQRDWKPGVLGRYAQFSSV